MDTTSQNTSVYLLAVTARRNVPGHPVPLNTLVVPAAALLRTEVRQPDGANMYLCLTTFPGRSNGEVVPISTLTHELAGGRNWAAIGDWASVVEDLLGLIATETIDALQMGLPPAMEATLSNGPHTVTNLHPIGGGPAQEFGPDGRADHLLQVTHALHDFESNEGPLRVGGPLVHPPKQLPANVYSPR